MSTQFQVDTQQLHGASSDVARIAAQIETDVAAMMSRLTALESTWHGSASSGFQQTMARWSATQRQVRESLVEITTMLGRAGQEYAAVEAANTALFRS